MNIAIVDDEIHYARQIQDCLKSSELWSSDIAIDVFESVKNLLLAFTDIVYDIVFLYIETNETKYNGIDAAKIIRQKYGDHIVKIVVVSSYEFYYKELYEIKPVAFIIKPIQYHELFATFKKCLHLIQLDRDENSIFLYKKQNIIKRILQKDILYFESEKRKMHIITVSDDDTFYSTVNEVQKQLRTDIFIRPHESFVINLDMVETFMPNCFIMRNGYEINISKGRVKEIKKQITIYLGRFKVC